MSEKKKDEKATDGGAGSSLLDIGKKSGKKEKLQKAIEEGQEKKTVKRHRRTKAELKQQKIAEEQGLLSDANYEIFEQILKMLSDMDAERYGITKVERTSFTSISKSYATICNYFLPGGKPIYFVIASATIQSMVMLQGRNAKIKEALKGQEINDEPNDKNLDTGKIGVGEIAPSETPIKKL